MSEIDEWATAGNLQPEPITVEIWHPLGDCPGALANDLGKGRPPKTAMTGAP